MNGENNSEAVPLDGRVEIAYKVVTEDMRSLGLKNNPNIITYPVGEWYILPEKDVVPGKGHFGGIWAAPKLSDAKNIRRYMMREYSAETRIFKAYIGRVLHKTSCRVKTDRIFLDDEILL